MAQAKKWNVLIDRIEGGKWVSVVVATYYSYAYAVNEAARLRMLGFEAGIAAT